MPDIITAVKREDGLIVLWQEGRDYKSIFFEYSDLIDQKINVLDLLEHPKMYVLDPAGHRITMK